MRITIDEQSRLVHVLKGAAMLTLALPHTKTRAELEAAAWGLEAALANASLVVVDSWHAIEEAGDLRQAVAAGALPEGKRASLAQIVTGADRHARRLDFRRGFVLTMLPAPEGTSCLVARGLDHP